MKALSLAVVLGGTIAVALFGLVLTTTARPLAIPGTSPTYPVGADDAKTAMCVIVGRLAMARGLQIALTNALKTGAGTVTIAAEDFTEARCDEIEVRP